VFRTTGISVPPQVSISVSFAPTLFEIADAKAAEVLPTARRCVAGELIYEAFAVDCRCPGG
jgi:hypothetical protein